MSRYLIISADCHAGLPTEDYRSYLESKYHERFDESVLQIAAMRAEMAKAGMSNPEFAEKCTADNEAGPRGRRDAARRRIVIHHVARPEVQGQGEGHRRHDDVVGIGDVPAGGNPRQLSEFLYEPFGDVNHAAVASSPWSMVNGGAQPRSRRICPSSTLRESSRRATISRLPVAPPAARHRRERRRLALGDSQEDSGGSDVASIRDQLGIHRTRRPSFPEHGDGISPHHIVQDVDLPQACEWIRDRLPISNHTGHMFHRG